MGFSLMEHNLIDQDRSGRNAEMDQERMLKQSFIYKQVTLHVQMAEFRLVQLLERGMEIEKEGKSLLDHFRLVRFISDCKQDQQTLLHALNLVLQAVSVIPLHLTPRLDIFFPISRQEKSLAPVLGLGVFLLKKMYNGVIS